MAYETRSKIAIPVCDVGCGFTGTPRKLQENELVAMVVDAAKSNVPVPGYRVPYAVSNTLLTLWGLVIVVLVT